MAIERTEIEWRGRTGPFSLMLGPGVFSPTATSKTLAEAIEIEPGDTVIDVGCGSGVLAFVAAKLGAAKVYGVDLSQRAVEAARENAKRLGLENVCEFRAGRSARAGARRPGERPDRRRLGHPRRHRGGVRLVRRGALGRPDRGRAPDEVPALDRRDARPRRPALPADRARSSTSKPILDGRARGLRRPHASVLEREFPLPDLVAKSKAVTQMVKDGLVSFRQRGQPLALAAPDLALRPGLSQSAGRTPRPPHVVARRAQVVRAAPVDREHDAPHVRSRRRSSTSAAR